VEVHPKALLESTLISLVRRITQQYSDSSTQNAVFTLLQKESEVYYFRYDKPGNVYKSGDHNNTAICQQYFDFE